MELELIAAVFSSAAWTYSEKSDLVTPSGYGKSVPKSDLSHISEHWDLIYSLMLKLSQKLICNNIQL